MIILLPHRFTPSEPRLSRATEWSVQRTNMGLTAIETHRADATSRQGSCSEVVGGQPRVVTTSWDDGDPKDLRVAQLLADFGLCGTFYVPIKGHHKPGRIDLVDVKLLASGGFEIGAHGVSLPNLTRCRSDELAEEVGSCKLRLEEILGKEVPMFAYPQGRYSRDVIASLKRAGYAGARTTRMLARDLPFDPFKMPTSVHVFPHTRSDYIRNLIRAFYNEGAWEYVARFTCARSWVELAKLIFDSVLQKGGIWHLYGHSWLITELRLWDSLAEVLSYVSGREGVLYLTNGQILSHPSVRRGETPGGNHRSL